MEKINIPNIPTRFFQRPTSEEVFAQWEREERDREEFKNRKSFKLVLPEGYVNNNKVITDDIIQELKNEKGERAFLFAGGVGCGKTYLSQIIAETVIPEKFRAWGNYLFTTTTNIWEDAKKGYAANRPYEPRIPPYYILDDLGAEDNTDASQEFVHNHLLKVYDRWKQGGFRLLIVSTNLGFEEITSRYTSRVESRFYEMFRLYRFDDKDFRKKKMRLVSSLKKV